MTACVQRLALGYCGNQPGGTNAKAVPERGLCSHAQRPAPIGFPVGSFLSVANGNAGRISTDDEYRLSMLRILYGASAAALETFRAADNPVDAELVADLERVIERTKSEIARLTIAACQS